MKGLKQSETVVSEWLKILNTKGRNKADEHWVKHILPTLSKNKDLYKKFSRIIVPLGRAVDKLALLIQTVEADEYHFLIGTKESFDSLDTLTKLTYLKPSMIRVHKVVINDPFSVHKIVREIWEEDRLAKTAVYISSGSTSLSAPLIMVARYFEFSVLYQEWGKYDMNIKQADPLQRVVKSLKDPIEYYGDLELEKAVSLFNKQMFRDVIKILDNIKRRTMRIEQVLFLETLTKGYLHWQKYEFRAASVFIQEAKELCSRFNPKLVNLVEKNLRFLNTLSNPSNFISKLKSPKYVLSFVYELNIRASHAADENSFMFAIIYLYRCMDIIFQSDLVLRKINPWNIEWSKLSSKVVALYSKEWQKLTGGQAKQDERIGLMQSATLLKSLDQNGIFDIKKVWEVSKFRNSLIIEHGDEAGNEKQYKLILKITKEIVESYKNKHNLNEISTEDAKFIKIGEKL